MYLFKKKYDPIQLLHLRLLRYFCLLPARPRWFRQNLKFRHARCKNTKLPKSIHLCNDPRVFAKIFRRILHKALRAALSSFQRVEVQGALTALCCRCYGETTLALSIRNSRCFSRKSQTTSIEQMLSPLTMTAPVEAIWFIGGRSCKRRGGLRLTVDLWIQLTVFKGEALHLLNLWCHTQLFRTVWGQKIGLGVEGLGFRAEGLASRF